MRKYVLVVASMCSVAFGSQAQSSVTAESSMLSDTIGNVTTVGGYGNAFYQRDNNLESSKMNLERFVLFFGNKFNNKFSFFSELELEDAKIAGGEAGGEVALEQCYIQYNINPTHFWKFGLFQFHISCQQHIFWDCRIRFISKSKQWYN